MHSKCIQKCYSISQKCILCGVENRCTTNQLLCQDFHHTKCSKTYDKIVNLPGNYHTVFIIKQSQFNMQPIMFCQRQFSQDTQKRSTSTFTNSTMIEYQQTKPITNSKFNIQSNIHITPLTQNPDIIVRKSHLQETYWSAINPGYVNNNKKNHQMTKTIYASKTWRMEKLATGGCWCRMITSYNKIWWTICDSDRAR